MTEKNLEKPKNCYDCMISNVCELFWQNSFSVRPLVLDKYRILGCEYEKLLQKLQGEASTKQGQCDQTLPLFTSTFP